MHRILPTMPISHIRSDQAGILDQAKEKPVVLTHKGEAAGVLIGVDKWNAIAEYIEDLEAVVEALQSELEVATGEAELIDADLEQLAEWAGRDAVPA